MSDNITIEPVYYNIEVVKNDNEVTIASPGPKGEKGSSVLKGSGAPAADIGIMGDYYLDSVSQYIYGPKPLDIAWDYSSYIKLQGVDGKSFLTGSTPPSPSLGNNGDTYFDTSTGQLYTKTSTGWQLSTNLVNPISVSYTYEQQLNTTTWDIVHDLGYRPSVFVSDYGQNNVECDIEHVSTNEVILTFSIPMSGYAYLS